jgi:serine/threonine-protein kinase RsbT
MIILKTKTLTVENDEDVVAVRQLARVWAVELGFSLVEQTKIITATSELARNTVIAGNGGTVLLEALDNNGKQGLRLTFEDEGPGIADVELAMRDGYTTTGGLGLGLGGSKRLMNEFEIASEVGKGTRVRITKWR